MLNFASLRLGLIITLFALAFLITSTSNVKALSGDANADNKVDGVDYTIWLLHYNQSASTGSNVGDFNANGYVDGIDYVIWLNNYGTIASPTPAPNSWWKPTSDQPISWHWQLTQDFVYPRDVLPYKTVYDIDGERATATLVAQLHALGPDIKVICYFDAGVWEDYRSDAGKFPGSQAHGIPYTGDPQYANANVIGKTDVGWDGSFWMDTRQIEILRPIMDWRIKNWCKDKGFDAIEPDETENQDENEGSNITGFNITRAQTIAYNKMIAEIAHKYGLSAGLKGNTTELAEQVQFYDWTLNEECAQYNECNNLRAFTNYRDSGYYANTGKAAFNIEYKVKPNCTHANTNRYNAAQRDLNLQGPTHSGYRYCPCVPDGSISWSQGTSICTPDN